MEGKKQDLGNVQKPNVGKAGAKGSPITPGRNPSARGLSYNVRPGAFTTGATTKQVPVKPGTTRKQDELAASSSSSVAQATDYERELIAEAMKSYRGVKRDPPATQPTVTRIDLGSEQFYEEPEEENVPAKPIEPAVQTGPVSDPKDDQQPTGSDKPLKDTEQDVFELPSLNTMSEQEKYSHMIELIESATLHSLTEMSPEALNTMAAWMLPTRSSLATYLQTLFDYYNHANDSFIAIVGTLTTYAIQHMKVARVNVVLSGIAATYIHTHWDDVVNLFTDYEQTHLIQEASSLIYGSDKCIYISAILPAGRLFVSSDISFIFEAMKYAEAKKKYTLAEHVLYQTLKRSDKLRDLFREYSCTPEAEQFIESFGKEKPEKTKSKGGQKPPVFVKPEIPVPTFMVKNLISDKKIEATLKSARPAVKITKEVQLSPRVPPLPTMEQVKSKEVIEYRRDKDSRIDVYASTLEDKDVKMPSIFALATGIQPDPEIDEEELITKYGDHSVYAVGTVDTKLVEASRSQVCNILSIIGPIINASKDNYSLMEAGGEHFRCLGNNISLPMEVPPFREYYVFNKYPVTVLKAHNIQQFTVQSTGRLEISNDIELPMDMMSASGTGLDTRKLVSASQSMIQGILRNLVEAIANECVITTVRCGMSQLFTRAHTCLNVLVNCDELGVEPRFEGLRNDDITLCIANPNNNQLAQSARQMINAISNGHIQFSRVEVSDSDIQCMKLISAGPECIHTPENAEFEIYGSHIHFDEQINWLILGINDNMPVVPNHINVTASMLRDFIAKMANLFGRFDDYVAGFIRASCLTTGSMRTLRKRNGERYTITINAMLEMYGTVMPGTWGDNMIWRLIKVEKATEQFPGVSNEFKVLVQNTPTFFGHLTTATGSLVSLSFSSIFHYMNMDGIVLTSVARNNARAKATDLIRYLTMCTLNASIPPICLLACGYLPQISAISITPYAFLTQSWSAFGITAASANQLVSWRTFFAGMVPYIADPPSFLYFNYKLDSNWGMSKPGVKGDFKFEIQLIGTDQRLWWCAANGSSIYIENAKAAISYTYVPYGGIALNTIMQETRIRLAHTMKFLKLMRVNALGATPVAQVPQEWPEFTFTMYPEIFLLKPGSLLTYDWNEEAVMAPSILLMEQAHEIQALIETSSEKMLFSKAGLNYQNAYTFTLLNTNYSDLLQRQRPGLGGGGDEPKKTKPTEEEVNAEVEKVVTTLPATLKLDPKA